MAYTRRELAEFDELTEMTSSKNQMSRISGRLRLKEFIAQHGDAKCDEMFAVLKKRDAKRGR